MARRQAAVEEPEVETPTTRAKRSEKVVEAKVLAKTTAKKPGTAVATRKSTAVGAVGDWKDELAKYVKKGQAMESSAAFSSLKVDRMGTLTLNGAKVRDNTITGIVLAQVFENAYYDTPYVEGQKGIPVCFALHDGERDEMVPHDEAKEKQSDTCDGCEWNKFGSGQGKAKACRQVKRLALLVAEDGANMQEVLEHGDIVPFTASVMNTKHWDAYEKHIREELDSIHFFWRTVIEVGPDKKAGYKVTYSAAERSPIPEKFRNLIIKRVKEAEEMLLQPYKEVEREEDDDPPARGKQTGGARGKKAQAAAAPKRSKY